MVGRISKPSGIGLKIDFRCFRLTLNANSVFRTQSNHRKNFDGPPANARDSRPLCLVRGGYKVNAKDCLSMPVYEYACRHCGHEFEYLVLHSSPAAECPLCSARDLEQLVSMCSVSSEASRQANLSAAHRRAASVRKEKLSQDHTHLHKHFEDSPTTRQGSAK
jgi:putative FmdB family regulatory protein